MPGLHEGISGLTGWPRTGCGLPSKTRDHSCQACNTAYGPGAVTSAT